MEVRQVDFRWEIPSFSARSESVGEYLESSRFPASKDEAQWYLEVYPHGDEPENQGWLSFHLRLESSPFGEERVNFKLELRNQSGETLKKCASEDFTLLQASGPNGLGSGRLISREFLMDRPLGRKLPGDLLILVCSLSIVQQHKVPPVVPPRTNKVSEHDLSEVMLRLFQRQDNFSDVVLRAGKRLFHAHKAVLANRSPTFAAMFRSNMMTAIGERMVAEIKIADVSEEAMEQVLRYIYTNKCSKTQAAELVRVAQRYGLDGLQLECESHLATGLNVDNACDMYLLACRCKAAHLEKMAVTFIHKNVRQVIRTVGWQNLLRSGSDDGIGHLVETLLSLKVDDEPKVTQPTAQPLQDKDTGAKVLVKQPWRGDSGV